MKNKIFYYLSIASMLVLFSSCFDQLDRENRETLSKDQIDKEYEYVKNEVIAFYTDIEDGFYTYGNAMEASVCDEAEYTYTGSAETFNSGSWDALSNPGDVFSKYYTAIRRINVYLSEESKVDLDAYKNDPDANSQQIYKARTAELENWRKEARFLRAYYYFELIKRYGGVPLLTQPLTLQSDFAAVKRDSLEKCVNFIVSECTELGDSENGLPLKYDDQNLGRATRGAALALKSRVLLYAASDLWNDPSWAGGYQESYLISLSNGSDAAVRRLRWKAAAEAAKAVIDISPAAGYALCSDYTVLGKTYDNSELIMVRRSGASNSFEYNNYPIGYPNGKGGITPSQNLVDAYEMADGSAFDWNNSACAQDPYSNRDPRLAMSILTNGAKFKDTYLECYAGGKNGKGVANATTTGYYLRKFLDEDLDLTQNRTSIHNWILFRISEIYLNYAEALNEYDPANPDVVTYSSMTRKRKGVNMPAFSASLGQSRMRDEIRNERQVELAFEGHRFWDVRRWMIAPQTLGAPLYGIAITPGIFASYERVKVENRVWEPKMYFFPIPQSLLSNENVKWSQNPLW